jgi:hypothetical protein
LVAAACHSRRCSRKPRPRQTPDRIVEAFSWSDRPRDRHCVPCLWLCAGMGVTSFHTNTQAPIAKLPRVIFARANPLACLFKATGMAPRVLQPASRLAGASSQPARRRRRRRLQLEAGND